MSLLILPAPFLLSRVAIVVHRLIRPSWVMVIRNLCKRLPGAFTCQRESGTLMDDGLSDLPRA